MADVWIKWVPCETTCITWHSRATHMGLSLHAMASTHVHRVYDSIRYREMLKGD